MNAAPRTARLLLLLVPVVLAAPAAPAEEPTPAATAAYNNYLARLEGRLNVEHRSAAGFVAGLDNAQLRARLRGGETVVEHLNAKADDEQPGAMLHHWRGTAFVPGAHAAEFERLLRDYPVYPRVYAPQVVTARLLYQKGDWLQATLRVRQHHVLTVVLDTAYDVSFAHLDAAHGASTAHGTHVAEIADAGTAKERALSPREQQGFLWRIDTYWSWAEQDGGLYLQIESVTLTRGIPARPGLGDWAVRAVHPPRVPGVHPAPDGPSADPAELTRRSIFGHPKCFRSTQRCAAACSARKEASCRRPWFHLLKIRSFNPPRASTKP
jgi:hypothetical protein